MNRPNRNDCIVAISSAWTPAPTGIIRLCGRDSAKTVGTLIVGEQRDSLAVGTKPRITRVMLRVMESAKIPADLYLFPPERSYSGTETVELHTVGSLPILRDIVDQLIAAGARPARGGEFTSRAFLNGKLNAAQVGAVLSLIHADSAQDARQSARLLGTKTERADALAEQLANTLALLEAGIDFVEEEGISFISAPEIAQSVAAVRDKLTASESATQSLNSAGLPHVVLAGPANAGKSTLFNALVGSERAIVSPIVGTTRDVISAPVRGDDITFILQDTAGFADATSDLDVAAHELTRASGGFADVVVWVHPMDQPWSTRERDVLATIDDERLLTVRSKCDLPPSQDQQNTPSIFANAIELSTHDQSGIEPLRELIAEKLAARRSEATPFRERSYRTAIDALARVLAALGDDQQDWEPELAAEDLRIAIQTLSDGQTLTDPDELLGRIFAQFCIGK